MAEESTGRRRVVATAAHGLAWLEQLELPGLVLEGGLVQAANRSAVSLFGEELHGQAFDEYFVALPGSRSSRRVRAKAGTAAGRRYAVSRQSTSQNGGEVAILRDVTRDVEREEALGEQLREVARSHRSGMASSWELDLKRLRVTLPHRLRRAFGSISRSMRFEEAIALVHADDIGDVKNAIRRAVSSGSLNTEVRLMDARGREHRVLLRAALTRDSAGQPSKLSGVAVGLGSGSPGRVEVEEQLALQVALLDNLADGVVRMTEAGSIVTINAAAERMTRWRAEEAVGKPLEVVVRLVDERSGAPLSALPGAESVGLVNCRLIRRDGTELPVRCGVRRLATQSIGPVWVVEMRDLSELRGLENQMLFRATHDGLTGLFDRVEFERRLSEALADARDAGHVHALCYVDLDNFKIVNDTCGHLAGDEMLKQVASLLRCNFRGSDVLGRLGGDEFGVLLTDCPAEKAEAFALSLCKDIKKLRFSWDGKVFNVTASVGLVTIDGQASSVADVLGAADGACYIAKQNGANRVQVYRPDDTMLSERRGQLRLMQGVQGALALDEFELFGQPIMPLYSGDRRIIELLLRMPVGRGKLLLPSEFMRVAEAHGLAVMIDRWVVREALDQLARNGSEPGFLGAAFAINLSGQSLSDESFLQYVLEQFETSRVEPSRVYFEITETSAISHLSRAMRFIGELRGRGSVFVLDDFGTGLSSFGYLRNLPVDMIKIDGQFVRGLTRDPIQRALVEAINQVGQVMQMKTVAEMVEDEATLEGLRAIKVDYAQGFHVARPVPLAELRKAALKPL